MSNATATRARYRTWFLLARYRTWFLLDGVVTGANAFAYLALHTLLPGLLGSTPSLYLVAGIFLAIVTIGLIVVAGSSRRQHILPEILTTINVIWAGASLVVAIANPFHLNAWGIIWTLAQALVVAAFAVLQFRALRDAGGRGNSRARR